MAKEKEEARRPRTGEERFAAYLDAIVAVLGHASRAASARAYCTGLLLPGERKSIEPMAARIEPGRVQAKHQSMHHVVAKAEWNDAALLRAVRERVLPAIERHGPVRYWIVDDTGFPKQGRHSVGVARQYCGQLGKQDNCQVAVSLSVANDQASLPIAYRLYLPEVWAGDPARRAKAGVPEEIGFETKRPSRSVSSGRRGRRGCRWAPCWPMPATATSATSGSGWRARPALHAGHPLRDQASGRPGRRHCRPLPGRAGDGRRPGCAAARTTSRSR